MPRASSQLYAAVTAVIAAALFQVVPPPASIRMSW
jgi:hypothetical protein